MQYRYSGSSIFFLFFIVVFGVSGCVSPMGTTFDKLPPGIWRGALYLEQSAVMLVGRKKKDVDLVMDRTGELPFNFEVSYDENQEMRIELINADERIRVDEIEYGWDKSTAKDTIIMRFKSMDSYIKAIFEHDLMEGFWYVNYKEGYKIPFKAYHGNPDRFYTDGTVSNENYSGRYNVEFKEKDGKSFPAVAEFEQNGNKIKGTFLTETGDFRYLEGNVLGNKLYLSCFDGSHAYLFEGKVIEPGKITGLFRSGTQYVASWEAQLNSEAKLPDPFKAVEYDSLTPLNLEAIGLNGAKVSLNDPKFSDRKKIIAIMGTWCPNCLDETTFIKEQLAKGRLKDYAIINVGFERYPDTTKCLSILNTYKETHQIPYEIWYGGKSDKKVAQEKFPLLKKLIAFPTLIILDEKNKIKHVYSGFTGPATSEYGAFVKQFENLTQN